MVPVAVVGIVVVVPVVMVSVVVVPVVGPPWTPVDRVVPPVPGGPPDHVPGVVDESDQRPGRDVIIGGGHHIDIVPDYLAGVSRIGRFGIDRFDDIVGAVEGLIPDQLDLDSSAGQLLHHENGHVLLFVTAQGRTQHNVVHIPVHIVGNRNIIDQVIAVQVQVVNHLILAVEAPLKLLEGLRFLEQVHDGIEIQVVSRQTKVLFGVVLCSCKCCGCDQDQGCVYGAYCFHGVQLFGYCFGISKAKAVPSLPGKVHGNDQHSGQDTRQNLLYQRIAGELSK